MDVTVTVNGARVTLDVEPRVLLVHFLRENLDLTGMRLWPSRGRPFAERVLASR